MKILKHHAEKIYLMIMHTVSTFYISREDNMIVFAYGITETGKLARRMPLHMYKPFYA